MNTAKTKVDGKVTVRVEGKIDTVTALQLEEELLAVDEKDVVVDLSAVEYVASAGLRVILNAQKTLLAAGGQLAISGANEAVRHVFTITGFARIIKFID